MSLRSGVVKTDKAEDYTKMLLAHINTLCLDHKGKNMEECFGLLSPEVEESKIAVIEAHKFSKKSEGIAHIWNNEKLGLNQRVFALSCLLFR